MMRTVLTIFFILIFYTGHASADESALSNVTLKQCYELALKRSETIAIQQQVIKETEGRILQAMNGVLPQVFFVDTEKIQDAPRHDGTNRRYTPQRQFTLSQPLFSGFKEFAAITGSRAERRQRTQELIRAKQLLFTDVSDAYYLFKSYQEDLEAVRDLDKALQERLAELKRREALGRSRPSEVASTESKIYQNQAEMEHVGSQQDVAKQLLEFLVGAKIISIADQDIVMDGIGSLAEYSAKADVRPDVVAAGEAALVAEKKIAVARSGMWPAVSIEGNDYIKRVGSASSVDWDVMLNVSVPIFNGTQTAGEIKEAKALYEQAKLNAGRIKRQAELDIENAYTQLVAGVKQVQAYQKAYEASNRDYELQLADYRNSQVSNLDVLQSLEDVQSTRREFSAVKNQTQRAYWALKVATGDIQHDAF